MSFKVLIVAAAGGMFAVAPVATAGPILDQNQPSGPTYMAAFSQTDLAQSFQTQQSSMPTIGAGILLQPGIGSTDTVVIELWTTLPNAGGMMLATGSTTGTQGDWADVFWDGGGVLLDADTTYYLHFTGNITLGIAGDTNNPYPFGHVFANPGFQPFPNFDYAFRTWVSLPAPGALALLGIAGLAGQRRRRN
jgi:hypothetical protein